MPSRLLNGEVRALHDGAIVASTHTTSYRFVLVLAPGEYTMNATADDPAYPTCSPVDVQVPPGRYVDVSIECQSS